MPGGLTAPTSRHRALQRFARAASMVSVAVGVVVLVGWMAGLDALKGLAPGWITMKANTAICFVLAGVGLWRLVPDGSDRIGRACAIAIVGIAAATGLQYVTGTPLGIDQLLFADHEPIPAPGRMSPITALDFVCLGAGLLLLDRGWTAQGAGALIGVMTVVCVVEYAFGTRLVHGPLAFNMMAVNTALVFLLLGTALICARPDRGWTHLLCGDDAGAVAARQLLPLAPLTPILLGWLSLQEQRRGLYDTAFGTALLSLGNATVLLVLATWTGMTLRRADLARRQADESLRISQAKWRILVEASPIGIIRADLQGRILEANAAFLEMVGYSRAELEAGEVRWDRLTPPEWAASDQRALEDLKRHGRAGPWEKQYYRKDGTRVPILSGLHRLDGTDECAGFILDLSDRKRIEEQLELARDEAEQASRAKSDFLAVMSHEIRTPMNGVLGMLELLKGGQLTDLQRERVDLARSSADTLLVLLNDVLDFSRIEAGRLQMEATPFDLRQAVEEVVRLAADQAGARGVDLIMRYPDGTPSRMVGDPTRIRQVISNLVSNAVKFTERGHVTVDVEQLGAGDGMVELKVSVRDTGIGIAPGRLDGIFEHFVQADSSTTRRFGGTGLGLAICKRLVDAMGGRIGVSSEQGVGSTFWFSMRLPLGGEGARAESTELTLRVALPRTTPEAASPRVLLVEDNAVNRHVAVAMLEDLGCRVEIAGDGRDALLLLGTRAYDLVLMDCQMPEMDGYEAVRELRRREGGSRRVPVVALTAHVLAGDRERCLAAGMDGYVPKPVTVDALRTVLERWCPGARPTTVKSLPRLDGGRLSRLREVQSQGRTLLDVLLPLFAAETPQKMASARAALETGDLQRFRREVHSVKGGCLSLGAMRMAALCQEMEAQESVEDALAKLTAAEAELQALLVDLPLDRAAPRP